MSLAVEDAHDASAWQSLGLIYDEVVEHWDHQEPELIRREIRTRDADLREVADALRGSTHRTAQFLRCLRVVLFDPEQRVPQVLARFRREDRRPAQPALRRAAPCPEARARSSASSSAITSSTS